MDAGVIVAIVVGALILLALVALLGKRGRTQRRETHREEAREIRREAEVRSAEADHARAEADQRAAKARQEEALARRQTAEADDTRRLADERHLEADERDPDVKTGGLFRRGRSDDRAGQEEADDAIVSERVHRERDAESGQVQNEEVEERRLGR